MTARVVGPGGAVRLVDADGHGVNVTEDGKLEIAGVDADGLTDAQLRATPVDVRLVADLVDVAFDDVEMVYTGDKMTGVIYRRNGNVVRELELVWSGNVLTRARRTV